MPDWYTLPAYSIFVLILPMRNGNWKYVPPAIPISPKVLILPMRNGNIKKIILEVKKWVIVLILPMRNGNGYWFWVGIIAIFVLILPMRNGNEVSYTNWCWHVFCSYPTYEEWKHEFGTNIGLTIASFLSYLWGMETFGYVAGKIHVSMVLILPMRNGN